MQVWAIANQKGGVGKTTTTLLLGRLLAARGQRVLLADLDPHASLTRAFGVPSEPPPPGTLDLFESPPKAVAEVSRATPIANLRLLPAQAGMATLERRSATAPGLGLALGQGLAAAAADYDYALLDCPPTLGLLMVNALAAADQLVVPTQTEPLGVHGMEGMLKTATMIERSRKRPLPARILPTLFDRRTRACTETLDLLREQHPDRTWVQAVPLDTRLRDAAELTHAELSHEVTQSRGFDAYQRALAWLLREAPQPQEQPA
ncbi:ParA family protein [Silanimonas sp.]|jgi:chromosome partitioning protein|uniref:ParA family protein n=1 Tax=Silanimonas sp. TaxID=1929290 RepID=UPI0037CB2E8E